MTRFFVFFAALVVGIGLASPAAAGDWGESWGSLLWGAGPLSTPVPTLGTWGLLLLGAFVAGAVSTKLERGAARTAGLVVAGALLVTPIALRAVTIPHTFVNGTVADANEVNANFQALESAVNLLEGGGGSPLIQFGRTGGCISSFGGHRTWIRFSHWMDGLPAFVATIDEGLDGTGPTWSRVTGRHSNQTAIRCDNAGDGFYWAAAEPGVHTIDGRTVQAGTEVSVANNATIFFPQAFASAPVVVIYIDESVDDNGGTLARIIGNVSTSGFQVWLNNTVDALHWIAMPAGTYLAEGAAWEAGVVVPGACTTCTFAFGQAFAHTPGLIATVNDTNNSGASWIRTEEVEPDQAQVRLDSATELVHYVAFLEQ